VDIDWLVFEDEQIIIIITDYLGADCSIRKAKVPVLQKYLVEDGCDLADMECRAMRVVVNEAANSRTLTCKIKITKVT